MFGALEIELGILAFDHARIAAQLPLRQAVAGADVVQHAVKQARAILGTGALEIGQDLGNDVNGMGKTEPIGVQSGLLHGRLVHQNAHGIMGQQEAVEFLDHAQGDFAAQGALQEHIAKALAPLSGERRLYPFLSQRIEEKNYPTIQVVGQTLARYAVSEEHREISRLIREGVPLFNKESVRATTRARYTMGDIQFPIE